MTTLKIKRTTVANRVPTSLEAGELAVNLTDGKLYVGTGSAVVELADADTATPSNVLALPTHTTTTRDALTPSVGNMIWNSTDSVVQLYNGTTWLDMFAVNPNHISMDSTGNLTVSGDVTAYGTP